jgi:hypothetical protein
MRKDASQTTPMARQRVWWLLALGAAYAGGCATGVDVTDEELAEICADPANRCADEAPVGGVGGSTSGPVGGSSSGSFNATGGSGSPSNGGSFSPSGGSGGSFGTSGSGGTGSIAPLAVGDCLDADDIVVLYLDRTSGAATNEPSMRMQVQNPGGTTFPLSDLAIRYWFTADGTSGFTGVVDYATINGQSNINTQINITFGQEFGSDYAEMTFPTLTDSIGAEGVRELQLRFHATPYAPLTQTNDFSFLQGATALTANRNITPYLQNTQVGGCVPLPP